MAQNISQLLKSLSPEKGFDLIRIYLGVGLAVRGLLFLVHPRWVSTAIESAPGASAALVGAGHLVGGLMLAAGLFTRLTALVQSLPVMGAVLVVHRGQPLASADQSLEFSGLVLVMLVFYAALGAGPWSLDHRRRQARAATAPPASGTPSAAQD